MSLASLGFIPFFETQHIDSSLQPARIVSPRGELFLVNDGASESLVPIRGALRNDPLSSPAVGDWVLLDTVAGAKVIAVILERRTAISRKRAGRQMAPQMLAANIDRVLIVMSLDQDFSVHRLERYLTLVWESGATPLIVLSKADLVADPGEQLRLAESRALGFPVFLCSDITGDGADQLAMELRAGETIVLLGSSGVGKSTLINRLAGSQLRRTGAIRSFDGNGRHTTTDRQLLRLPSGVLVIDSPGLREVQLWADQDSLDHTFAELAEAAQGCRFSDCSHRSEPGCAVQSALAEGRLDPDRLASYWQLRDELRHLDRQVSLSAAQEHKSHMKEMMRAQKSFYKFSDKRRT